MIKISREARRQLERDNAKWPAKLQVVPRSQWHDDDDPKRRSVFRSRNYLVQVFDEPDDVTRLSICRTNVNAAGGWHEDLTWDELQEIKRQAGMGDKYAIEVFPRDTDVANVANMRHLWVLPTPLPIGWFDTPLSP